MINDLLYYLLQSTTNVEEDIPQPNTQPSELQDVTPGSIPDARDESTYDLDTNIDCSCPLSDAPVESDDDLCQLDTADSGEQEFSDGCAQEDLDAEIAGPLPCMY